MLFLLVHSATACIQAHTSWTGQGALAPDLLSMEAWVNGRLVCSGGESDLWSNTDKTYCLRNSDGKGTGCAPGYAICSTDNGRDATVYYYGKPRPIRTESCIACAKNITEDNKEVYSQKLSRYDTHNKVYDCPICIPGNDLPDSQCPKCTMTETVLKAHTCSNVPGENELCDFRDICYDNGLPHDPENYDPIEPFPFKPFKVMIAGDSISHGAEDDYTWRYRLWHHRKCLCSGPKYPRLCRFT